jgi:TonB family protein
MDRVGILCSFFLLAQICGAQDTDAAKPISEGDARQHLVQDAEPVYPRMVQPAGAQGDVALAVTIDAKGQVVSEKVLSGPPMLQQSVLDAVRHWQFTPFLDNGVAVPVTTRLTIAYPLPQSRPAPTADQEQAEKAWFPLSAKCMKAIQAQNPREAVEACKQTLNISLKVGDQTPSDQLARTGSLQMYGHALLLANQKQAALAQEYMAVDEVRKCLTDKDQEYAMPFFWRGVVEANLGQNDPALADFTVAEATHRRAIANLPDMKAKYGPLLAAILKEHAALLDRMGRADEAAKLRAEAASL